MCRVFFGCLGVPLCVPIFSKHWACEAVRRRQCEFTVCPKLSIQQCTSADSLESLAFQYLIVPAAIQIQLAQAPLTFLLWQELASHLQFPVRKATWPKWYWNISLHHLRHEPRRRLVQDHSDDESHSSEQQEPEMWHLPRYCHRHRTPRSWAEWLAYSSCRTPPGGHLYW